MKFKITFLFFVLGITCYSQPAFLPVPSDTLTVELNADISSNFESFHVHIDLANTTTDTLMMVWRKEMYDCPLEWKTVIADPHQHFFPDVFSNYDTLLNIDVPAQMLPDQLAEFGFGVELFPYSTPGCCTIPVHFSLLEAPDSIISTAYFRFAINDPSCDFVNDFEEVENKVVVFPNPADNVAYIESERPVQSVQIFNVSGQQIKTEIKKNKIEINYLNKGVYFFKIELSGGKLVWQKIEKI